MTDSKCWIDYRVDLRTCERNAKGWYGEPSSRHRYDLGTCPKNGYWPAHLESWCKSNGIPFEQTYSDDGASVSRANVTKQQLQSFVAFMYDEQPHYNEPAKMLFWKGRAYAVHQLIDLRAFIAQELVPEIIYELAADAW